MGCTCGKTDANANNQPRALPQPPQRRPTLERLQNGEIPDVSCLKC